MYYVLTLLSVIILAVDFAFKKKYQLIAGENTASGLYYNAVLGLTTAIVFFFINGFMNGFSNITVNPFVLATATGMGVCSFVYCILGFVMMAKGTMAFYMIFLMTGGMLVPYVFGVVSLGEWSELAPRQIVLRIVGMLIMIFGVIISNRTKNGGKIVKSMIILGICVFFLNGGCSVSSKIHQLPDFSDIAATAESFVMLTGFIKFLLCAGGLVFLRAKSPEAVREVPRVKTFPWIIASTVASGVSYLFQLYGASHMPASVLYPLITGGCIVFTSFAGVLCFKEKLTKEMVLGIALCTVGTLFFI